MTKEPFTAFESFIAYLDEIDGLLHLSTFAISNLQGVGRLTEVLERYDKDRKKKFDHKTSRKRIEEANRIEAMAQSECAKGFPIILNHSTVALWSALEACIPKFCSNWLLAHPEFLGGPDLEKLKIPIALLKEGQTQQTMDAVVAEISRVTAASEKIGVGRFQAVLGKIGLGFGVDDELGRTLYELSKIRNLIVHNYARADQRFAADCPWWDLKTGEELRLNLDDYYRFRKAAGEYAAQIVIAAESVLEPDRD